jgi:hypothetical protein
MIIKLMPDDKNLIDRKITGQESPERKNFENLSTEKEPIRPIRPEKEIQPENNIEKDSSGFRQAEGSGGVEMTGGIISATQTSQKQKEQETKIEKILEEGLEDVYKKLPVQKQMEFRVVGERTAKDINLLIEKAKFSVAKILDLIKKWLSIIPGVNNFFIEQEAKIKADKIIKIKSEENNF